MKRILWVALVVFTFQFCKAQNTYPTSGNVGLGTTSPLANLHVYSSALYPRVYVQSTSGSGAPGYTITETNGSEAWTWHYDIAGGFTGFFRTGFGNTMAISNSGKVGIGTTAPIGKLELNTTSISTGVLRLNSSATGANSLNIASMGTGEVTGGGGRSNVASYIFQRGSDGADMFQLDLTNRQAYFIGGNVGIGTTTPEKKLHVAGTIKVGSYTFISEPNNGLASVFSNNLYAGITNNTIVRHSNSNPGSYINIRYDRGIIFGTGVNSTAGSEVADNINERMRIDLNGNVGIGTTNTQGYRLAVNGDAIFTKVKVKTYTTWPDYVFHRNYNLCPLQDLENFIKKNNHLPDVPSASDVEKTGLDLGDNQTILLKKIEELTLYIIDQDKKITDIQYTNKKLEEQSKSIESLTKEVQALKSLLSNK